MVEGIRALYINGAPVLHTDVWFSYIGGLKIKIKRKKKKNEYLFFNFKTIYMKYENVIINFKTIISTTFRNI